MDRSNDELNADQQQQMSDLCDQEIQQMIDGGESQEKEDEPLDIETKEEVGMDKLNETVYPNITEESECSEADVTNWIGGDTSAQNESDASAYLSDCGTFTNVTSVAAEIDHYETTRSEGIEEHVNTLSLQMGSYNENASSFSLNETKKDEGLALTGETMKLLLPTLAEMHRSIKDTEQKVRKADFVLKNVIIGMKEHTAIIQSLSERMAQLESKAAPAVAFASAPTLLHPSCAAAAAATARPVSSGGRSRRQSRPGTSRRRWNRSRGRGRSTSCATPHGTLFAERLAAMGEQLLVACSDGRERDAKKLLDAGADPNFMGAGRWTPLQRAAASASVDIVSLLLSRDVDVNTKNCNGSTALHAAAENDFSGRCVERLARAGAALSVRDRYGRTALHYAAERGNARAVFALVQAGASRSMRDDKGRTPLDVVRSRCVSRILRARPHTHVRARRRKRSRSRAKSVKMGGGRGDYKFPT